MGPIHGEFSLPDDESDRRPRTLINLRFKVLEEGLCLLPIQAAIQPPNLFDSLLVLSHGVRTWYHTAYGVNV